jgi:hypothetical protein
LTEEERKVTEKHSEYGWAILKAIPGFGRASLLVLHHHERMDGMGYPSKLKASQIPIGPRIISVIDSFDAMVSDRAYRKGLCVEEAMRLGRSSTNGSWMRSVESPIKTSRTCMRRDCKERVPEFALTAMSLVGTAFWSSVGVKLQR